MIRTYLDELLHRFLEQLAVTEEAIHEGGVVHEIAWPCQRPLDDPLPREVVVTAPHNADLPLCRTSQHTHPDGHWDTVRSCASPWQLKVRFEPFHLPRHRQPRALRPHRWFVPL